MGKKHHLISTSHKCTLMTYCSLMIETLSSTCPRSDLPYWTRDQRHDREQHYCFLLGFTSCRSGGKVNFTLLFTTNATSSISTLQSFYSWVGVFYLRPPKTILFHKIYDMSGLALLLLLWTFYWEGHSAFHWGSQAGMCRSTFEILNKEVSWSMRGSWTRTIYSHTLHLLDITLTHDLLPN